MFTINSRLLRDSDCQPTLMIIPRIWLINHPGGNYKVVSVQGDFIFAECTYHENKLLIKIKIRLSTEEAGDVIRMNLSNNNNNNKARAVLN
jgi:hypothetical protein